MLQVLARELAAVSPDLRVRLYPEGRLFGESEVLDGLSAGTLELALLSRAQLEALAPELQQTPEHSSDPGRPPGRPFPGEAGRPNVVLQQRGLKWLSGLWLPCALYDRSGVCRGTPSELAAAPTVYLPFDAPGRLLEEPSSAPVTRVAEPQAASAGITPELNLTDGQRLRLPEGACVVLQGPGARFYDYVALVISLPAWRTLNDAQKAALSEAAAVATQYGLATLNRTLEAPEDRLAAVNQNGRLRVRFQTPEEQAAWSSTPQNEREAHAAGGQPSVSTAGTPDPSGGSDGRETGPTEPTKTQGDQP